MKDIISRETMSNRKRLIIQRLEDRITDGEMIYTDDPVVLERCDEDDSKCMGTIAAVTNDGVWIEQKHPDNNIYQRLQNEKEYLFTELIKARYSLDNCHTSKNKITSDILQELKEVV